MAATRLGTTRPDPSISCRYRDGVLCKELVRASIREYVTRFRRVLAIFFAGEGTLSAGCSKAGIYWVQRGKGTQNTLEERGTHSNRTVKAPSKCSPQTSSAKQATEQSYKLVERLFHPRRPDPRQVPRPHRGSHACILVRATSDHLR